MAIKYQLNERDDEVIYTNNGKRLRVYYPDILEISFVARDWHGGQNSALYSLASTGNPDPDNLYRALREVHKIEVAEAQLTDEEYEDYLTMVENLERIVGKLERLDD